MAWNEKAAQRFLNRERKVAELPVEEDHSPVNPSYVNLGSRKAFEPIRSSKSGENEGSEKKRRHPRQDSPKPI